MALALCRADPDDAGAVGPWLLAGAARRGESLWFTVADEGGTSVGMLVLVRRPVGRAADVGFAPSGAAPGVAVVGAALRLVAREAFDELALERLETRVRTRDDTVAAALDGVGFTCVGYDRDDRLVWSLVPRDLR